MALPATVWPWLGQKILAAWLVMMLALCLGVLSFAAVREMTVDCRRQPNYILTTETGDRLALEDGVNFLVSEEKHLRCRLAMGDAFDISFPP
ncbi:MAG: hypothetical protein E8A46_12435 [Bradyrhizobium sp.]|jgi:hypothetical protein|uniref:hypothetical protein n=1 Tax=Bradyrhizobium sp. TaxID=376 RepID=UPI0012152A1F|nr:hypothetical protein [Bradyrhizobium sp.]THD52697.1 MAG: hypothetical protein E8A46_12435 [Bradyrhizobium sp.]